MFRNFFSERPALQNLAKLTREHLQHFFFKKKLVEKRGLHIGLSREFCDISQKIFSFVNIFSSKAVKISFHQRYIFVDLLFCLFFLSLDVEIYDSQDSRGEGEEKCSIKKGVLKNFAKFTGKCMCWGIFFLIKLQV